MSATVKVVLHGRLKKFGGPFEWGVKTPKEAVRALCVMRPGFQEVIGQGQYKLIRGSKATGAKLEAQMLGIQLPPGSELHIMPVAKGAGGHGGIGKVILGAVLIAAAWEIAPAAIGGLAAASSASLGAGVFGASFAAGVIAKIGVFMIFDGISQMLAPTHKAIPADAQKSFTLSPPANAQEQGNPVPLIYGTTRVGSVQVSAGYSAYEIAVGTNAPIGSPYYIPGYTPGVSK